MRERLALNAMLTVGRAFRHSDRTVNLEQLSQRLRIPTITVAPIVAALERKGLLTTDESENLLPGLEMSRIRLNDIVDVVRVDGETGSHRDPKWNSLIQVLCDNVDNAVQSTLAERSLSDLLDDLEQKA